METIVVALITFLSGLLGSLVGVWGSVKQSKMTSQQELLKSLIAIRTEVYQNFWSAFLDFEQNYNDVGCLKRLYLSAHTVELLSSQDVQKAVWPVIGFAKRLDFSSDAFLSSRSKLLNAMQRDLLTLQHPGKLAQHVKRCAEEHSTESAR